MNQLDGKRGLVVGIANANSIAYGCDAAGAELAATYLNEKAEPYVRPLAESMACGIIAPCDVREPGQLDATQSTDTGQTRLLQRLRGWPMR